MNRPYKYTIFDNKTGEYTETNIEPLLRNLQTYEPTETPNVGRLTQTKTAWIDTRCEAKLRLYRYWQRINGIIEPKYEPFAGTEVGKSIPILNF